MKVIVISVFIFLSTLFYTHYTWASSDEFHIYYVRGGFKPEDPSMISSIPFWYKHMASLDYNVRQAIFHNYDNSICDVVSENYDRAVEDRKSVKIALIGYSWGGPAILNTAHCLNKKNITVQFLLTVDPVIKFFNKTAHVPDNVVLAHNIFNAENGLIQAITVSKLWRELGKSSPTVFNQKISGYGFIDHVDFPKTIEHCVLNRLYNFVMGYRIRANECVPKLP